MFDNQTDADRAAQQGWQQYGDPTADETGVSDAWKQYASGPNAAETATNNDWTKYGSGPNAAESATSDAWKKYASGPTADESGLISSAKDLAAGSDPRLAAASADKTNVADTTGDQYLGGQYKGMVEHGGLNPTQAAALRTSADLAARSASDTAREDIGRTIAKRGNAAGAYAALSKVGADANQSAGERERQNVLDMATLARQDKTAGLSGLGDISGREQGKNLSQAQIDASRNAQNASLADAGSNRVLSATTSGLGTLGNALSAQRGYSAAGLNADTAANAAQRGYGATALNANTAANAAQRGYGATGIGGQAASNTALAGKQNASLTAATNAANTQNTRSQQGAAQSNALWQALNSGAQSNLDQASNAGTKVGYTTSVGSGTGNSGSMGFSI
jgi:hypothetical protein